MVDDIEQSSPHITTRRGFVAATGFGIVSLYGLWAAYGAAPLNPFAFEAGGAPAEGMGGHGGHSEAAGLTADEFRRLTEEFVSAYRLSDGSVQVHRGSATAVAADDPRHGTGQRETSGEGQARASRGENDKTVSERTTSLQHEDMGHAMHGEPAEGHREEAGSLGGGPATDVYLMVSQWSYLPAVLRLEANIPYRFRMMAIDVSHGASIQLGRASRMIRLRARTLVEQPLRFALPGEYLVYCTVYCGMPHDRMQGKIIVS